LSQFDDSALFARVIAAGGAGYLRKTVEAEGMVTADIRTAYALGRARSAHRG
jgi:DNA-binding NarL/FixJ family response regulator